MLNELKKTKLCLGFIILIGLGLRLWGIGWGLPYQYQTEEYKIIKYALRMGSGDLNPHFFEYPSLYLYFILFINGFYFLIGRAIGKFNDVGAFAHFFVKDPTSFYLIGRILESLFGIGVIILTYKIAKLVFEEKVACLAAFLCAILPEFVYKGHIVKGDMAAIFLGLLFWILNYKIYKTGEKKYYFFSGIILGLAISTKYYLLMMGILLPLGHFFSVRRASHWYLFLALICIPTFFLIGTPYSLLDFKEFYKFYMDQKFFFTTFTGLETTYLQRFASLTYRFSILHDFKQNILLGSLGIGILSFAGFINLCIKWKKDYLFFIVPLLVYWFIVAAYHNPAAGYLAPIFPLFIICGAQFIFKCFYLIFSAKIFKFITFLFIFISLMSSLGESIKISYSYSLKDTRTIAKEWVEKQISPGNKILMDIYAYSPPLEMTKEQLEKFYRIASEINSYKRDYFRLKLDNFEPGIKTYEIFLIKRSPKEIGSLPYQVSEAQKVQDLIEFENIDLVFKNLEKNNIKYVITNSWAKDSIIYVNEIGAEFYRTLPEKAKLLQEFMPRTIFHPGPLIRIYQLNNT